jgi:hypothetical protein
VAAAGLRKYSSELDRSTMWWNNRKTMAIGRIHLPSALSVITLLLAAAPACNADDDGVLECWPAALDCFC